MDPATILGIINGAAQIARSVAPIVVQGTTVFGSNDQAQIKAALADLQAANDALHDRVQTKLRTPVTPAYTGQ